MSDESLYLVGYNVEDGTKINRKIRPRVLFSDIERRLDELENKVNPDFEVNKNQTVRVVPSPVLDDDGNKIYSEIDLKKTLSFVEINGGGDYSDENVIFVNRPFGCITNVVIDNSGDDNGVPPDGDFVFSIGTVDDKTVVASVPAYNIGVVQILHTTDSDIVISVTYSDANNYIKDAYVTTEYVDDGVAVMSKTVDDTGDETYVIDMEEQRHFIEFTCKDENNTDKYIFICQNPEYGSMTYLLVNNGTSKTVDIWYGKSLDDGGYMYVTQIESGNRYIIEIFHGLSYEVVARVITI